MRWLSRLVSIALVLAAIGGGVMWIYAQIPTSHVGKGFTTYAFFRDASRLAKGSPVRIAGVKVGDVTSLVVRGSMARVDMRLDGQVNLAVDSWVTKRAESAFGDNYIEIIPGAGENGAATQERLKDGDEIEHVIEGTSTDALLRGMNRAMPRLDRTLETLHEVVTGGRAWVNGKFIDGVGAVGTWIDEDHLDGPIQSADRAIARIEDGAMAAAGKLDNAEPDLIKTLDRYNQAVVDARGKIADFKQGLGSAMANVNSGLDQVDKPIDDATALVAAINEGRGADWKGTLGRLVNDPQLADDIDDAVAGVAAGTDGLIKLHSYIGLRLEYDIFASHPRAYATAEIRARNDKYYLIELETGPMGALPQDSLSSSPATGSYTRATTIDDSSRYTFQFGKQFGRLGLRGGIKDSTFGLGADMLFLRGRLKLNTDVYGSFDRIPRIKVAGAVQVFRDVYISAGVDDMLNGPHYLPIVSGDTTTPHRLTTLRYGRDWFLGGTIQFTDEDLALLLRVYGAVILGLIK